MLLENHVYETYSPREKLDFLNHDLTALLGRLNDLRQDKAIGSRELSLAYTEAQTAGFWMAEAVAMAKATDS